MAKEIYTEGVFGFLLKMFSFSRMKKEIDREMKKIEDDPEGVNALQSLKRNSDRIEEIMKEYCRLRPDDDICKEGGWDKYYKSNGFKAHYD